MAPEDGRDRAPQILRRGLALGPAGLNQRLQSYPVCIRQHRPLLIPGGAKRPSSQTVQARTGPRFAVNSPAGTPICGQDAARPRLLLLPAHSIDINTDPPHSPPTPTPWIKRKMVRITAPQMPMVA